MTLREINEGNRIIAEFMGYEYIPFNNTTGLKPGWWYSKTPPIIRGADTRKLVGGFYLGRSVKDLKYHKDWNYLIYAIKKWDCLNENPIPIAINITLKKVEKQYVELCDELDHLVTLYEQEPVFEHFVKCIQWYNHVRTGK